MKTTRSGQIDARLLATAHLARAVALFAREIAQSKGDIYVDDILVNFEKLGLSDVDSVYVIARLAGNPIDPILELVVSPCLLGLVVPGADGSDLPAPDADTLREWAGIPPAWLKPKGWSRVRPSKTAFDRTMPAAAFQAVVAAFAAITFVPPPFLEVRKQRHLDALRALVPADEAATFIDLAAAASIAGVLQKVTGGRAGTERQTPGSADGTPRLY